MGTSPSHRLSKKKYSHLQKTKTALSYTKKPLVNDFLVFYDPFSDANPPLSVLQQMPGQRNEIGRRCGAQVMPGIWRGFSIGGKSMGEMVQAQVEGVLRFGNIVRSGHRRTGGVAPPCRKDGVDVRRFRDRRAGAYRTTERVTADPTEVTRRCGRANVARR